VFAREGAVVGPASQVAINRLLRRHLKIKAAIPDEGTTGRSDNWMIAASARHPNCMYLWMNYISGATANAALAEHTYQAPANPHACDLTTSPGYCDTYRAANEDLFGKVEYWATPMRDCGDSRGDVCEDYAQWARAWREVTRS
jgi:putative spermidine/putrescine transport system substrate-binding protein